MKLLVLYLQKASKHLHVYNTINVYISEYYYDKDGEKHNISERGEGATTLYRDGDQAVVVSGLANRHITDENDISVPDPAEMILAHELAGHAEPNVNMERNKPLKNAIEIENKIRDEIGMTRRKEDSSHVQ